MARAFDDGSNQYLRDTTTAVVSSHPCTFACWAYSDDDTIRQYAMGIGNTGNSAPFIVLEVAGTEAGDPVRFTVRDDSSNLQQAITSTGYSVNTWHHIAGVWVDADNTSAFIDGGSKGTDNSPTLGTLTGNNTTIGANLRTSLVLPWSGRIAEAAVWNVALSDAEIASLSTGISPLAVRPQSIVSYWPLIRDEDLDRVGSVNLTDIGSPTVAEHPPIRKLWPVTIFTPNPVNHYAGMGWRNQHPTMRFSSGVREYSVYTSRMPSNYGGNGIELNLHYSMATATSGNVKWGAAFERIGDQSQDVDERGFADFNYRDQEVPGTSGYVKVAKIRFINGADMDSVVAGDQFRLKIVRDGFVDGATGDAELHHIEIQELA